MNERMMSVERKRQQAEFLAGLGPLLIRQLLGREFDFQLALDQARTFDDDNPAPGEGHPVLLVFISPDTPPVQLHLRARDYVARTEDGWQTVVVAYGGKEYLLSNKDGDGSVTKLVEALRPEVRRQLDAR
jgi:hypothetical protein